VYVQMMIDSYLLEISHPLQEMHATSMEIKMIIHSAANDWILRICILVIRHYPWLSSRFWHCKFCSTQPHDVMLRHVPSFQSASMCDDQVLSLSRPCLSRSHPHTNTHTNTITLNPADLRCISEGTPSSISLPIIVLTPLHRCFHR